MSEYRDRIADLAERSREDREAFEPPADPPAEAEALSYLRSGVGEVVAVYVEGRTGEFAAFDDVELSLLERALNDWLELYARCYGEEIDAEFTVREVAELVVATHDVTDVAQLLTHVPRRREQA
ncbi:hypothetical protein [Halomicrococcus gelatinilyticus]|uniref:hypothetical protein n=1 Tax=Halomicrococcus gelatinilyticus TaxID=1702103 RepID=UPI002E166EFB